MKIIVFNGSLTPPSFITNLVIGLGDDLQNKIFLLGFGRPLFDKAFKKTTLVSLGANNSRLNFALRTIIIFFTCLAKHPHFAIKHLSALRISSFSKRNLTEFNLKNTIAYLSPDIIHIQWASHISFFRFLLDMPPANRHPRVIVSLRGRLINIAPVADTEIGTLYKQYFPKVDAFHAVSKAIGIEASNWGAPFEKIKVIYSGLNLNLIQNFQKNNWGIHEKIKILSVGRSHWKKGYHYGLNTLKLLLNEGYKLHYTIIAGGELGEILYQINELELNEYVDIIDRLPQEEVFRHMQTSDMLLLPSVEEGIANVVLEAMAIGLPVVSSDCGGMAEVIENDKNGFLFPNRSVSGIAESIKTLMTLSPFEREKMAIEGRNKIMGHYSMERLSEEMTELYQCALASS